MTTELTEITRNIKIYNNPPNEQAFTKAIKILTKYHKKYGTIDVSTIQNLIK